MGLKDLNIDDRFVINSLHIPNAKIDGAEFSGLYLNGLSVRVIDTFNENKVCLFDRAIFESRISAHQITRWNDSALYKYLSTVFNTALTNTLKCKTQTDLLTPSQLSNGFEQLSNLPIPPKTYNLNRDILAFFSEYNNVTSYWLGSDTSDARYVDAIGVIHCTKNASITLGVRPVFMIKCNDSVFKLSDMGKYNKKLEVQRTFIDSVFKQNGISYKNLDLFSDMFKVTICGKELLLDYDTFYSTSRLKELKDMSLKVVIF